MLTMHGRDYRTALQVSTKIWFLDTGQAPTPDWTSLTHSDRAHFVVDSGSLAGSSLLRSQLDHLAKLPSVNMLTVSGGERAKTLRSVRTVIEWLDRSQVTRRSEPVVVIGGGAVLDYASLAVSLYRRGVTLVKIPTTLTGMVDVAFAAKTAINLGARKNLVGTFFPAHLAIIDVRYVGSTSLRDIRAGAAEMIKAAVVGDRVLFEDFESRLRNAIQDRFQDPATHDLVRRSAEASAQLLWSDLFETSLERPLDFGHSVSKQFEQALRPRLSHGSAVAIDMALFVTASATTDRRRDTRRRLLSLLEQAGLPTLDGRITPELLQVALSDTATHRDGLLSSPVPDPIGRVLYEEFDAAALSSALRWLERRKAGAN